MLQSVSGALVNSDIVSTAFLANKNMASDAAGKSNFQDCFDACVKAEENKGQKARSNERTSKPDDVIFTTPDGRELIYIQPAKTEEEAQNNLKKLKEMSQEELDELSDSDLEEMTMKCMTSDQWMMVSFHLQFDEKTSKPYAERQCISAGNMGRISDYFGNQAWLQRDDAEAKSFFSKLSNICKEVADIYRKRQ